MDGDREQDKRAELLKLWREYGKVYHFLVRQKQVAVRPSTPYNVFERST
jgi:hypothetical protein